MTSDLAQWNWTLPPSNQQATPGLLLAINNHRRRPRRSEKRNLINPRPVSTLSLWERIKGERFSWELKALESEEANDASIIP